MLIELLSMSNYVSYNVKVAEVLGLHAAIYISELMNINDKAIRKNKINNTSFKLDRSYMTKRTTISEDEQIDIENNLMKIGLIEKPSEDKDDITLNINILTALLMSTDEELIGNIKNLKKGKNTSKSTKAEKIREQLKSNIVTTNEELREAYSSWIDTVYAKQGWMSKKSVIAAQQIVDDFSHRDLDVALQLISIADTNGYRDMEWAVNKYKQDYNLNYRIMNNQTNNNYTKIQPKLSDEVF